MPCPSSLTRKGGCSVLAGLVVTPECRVCGRWPHQVPLSLSQHGRGGVITLAPTLGLLGAALLPHLRSTRPRGLCGHQTLTRSFENELHLSLLLHYLPTWSGRLCPKVLSAKAWLTRLGSEAPPAHEGSHCGSPPSPQTIGALGGDPLGPGPEDPGVRPPCPARGELRQCGWPVEAGRVLPGSVGVPAGGPPTPDPHRSPDSQQGGTGACPTAIERPRCG